MGWGIGEPTLESVGLSRQWDAEDREDVTEFHARLRKKKGIVASDPDAVESIQWLLWEGYSATDIGVFLGLSRERVRQVVEEFDLERPYGIGSHFRLWSWDEERFVPVTTDEIKNEVFPDLVSGHIHGGALACNEDVDLLNEMSRETDGYVLLKDLAERRGCLIQEIGLRWGARDGLSYREAWDRLYAAAGLERLHVEDSWPVVSRKGEDSPTSKLTEPDVLEIRRRRNGGETCAAIAEDYPVTRNTISMITNRHSWTHI